MADTVLIINSGSSSLKFSLYFEKEKSNFVSLVNGLLEGIGTKKPHLIIKDQYKAVLYEKNWTDPDFFKSSARDSLFDETLDWIFNHLGDNNLLAVGHRVVHGGAEYTQPVLLTQKIYNDLKALTPFVPLHQPGSLSPMRVMMEKKPNLKQIVCFDTSFHSTMPDKAKRFPLPRKYFNDGVRRYGFHGLSYQYIVHHLKEKKSPLVNGNLIVAHLGNGASITAIKNGKCIDTSMSFTPLDGLMMGTRCGHIDAAIILYMQQTEGLSHDEIETLIWKKSGLLGVSEISSDMRDIVREIKTKGPKAEYAQQAFDLFTYKLTGEIGRLAASLEGVDGIVFTAGIGENAPNLRAAVCKSLKWLGLQIDETANMNNDVVISTAESKVLVQVIPTDEESIMLQEVLRLTR